jgi:purine-binding chemotaxis protein CheW
VAFPWVLSRQRPSRIIEHMGAIQKTVDKCIVIVDVDIEGETIQLGALADSVQEVVDIDVNQIGPAPKLGPKLNTEFIRGMGKRGDDFLIILDIDRVLSGDELSTVAASTPVPETHRSVEELVA